MPRFRRYRVFLFFAAAIVYVLVRFTHRTNWPESDAGDLQFEPPGQPEKGAEEHGAYSPAKATAEAKQAAEQPPLGSTRTEEATSSAIAASQTTFRPESNEVADSAPRPPTIPDIVIPERKPRPANAYGSGDGPVDDVHPIAPPGRHVVSDYAPAKGGIHWESQVQHFPVPTESIIQLPTGKPRAIPKIQYAFERETYEAMTTRENRQAEVKEEFQKVWAEYKEHAWLHDELSPVSGKSRDPFCGWAATLVDSLDTLWIMGLEAEFEEAAKAVDLIDFTTSLRTDIPVFETTIRYMGGLLAAYDVSGGKYKNLLDKAIELAEILMGAFDTPNRMPLLYYNWKPAFASQPHRASHQSNLAELGSLSLEFTRLAQLTRDTRYYDAIARVTDALSEWQDRGTPLDGVFPEEVDASGCNRTAPLTHQQPIAPPSIVPSKDEEQVLGYQPATPDTVQKSKPNKKASAPTAGKPGTLEFQITPGEPSKARILDWDNTHPNQEKKQSLKRDLGNETTANTTPTPTRVHPISGRPLTLEARQEEVDHCVPQGLTTARTIKFSMGGGQDSTYEYLPKEYLLLGGLEHKYQKMYMKTIAAIRKKMLYRPMVPTGANILFTGALSPQGPDLILSAEVEHLTCFLGGMVGMAAKIFDIEDDLDMAKRLTDGCVWAYNSTASGIMPEGGIVLPCDSIEHCPWNQTTYYRALDPYADARAQRVADYIERKKALEDAKREREAEAARVAAEEQDRLVNVEAYPDQPPTKEMPRNADLGNATSHNAAATSSANTVRGDNGASIQKRDIVGSPKEEISIPTAGTTGASVKNRQTKDDDAKSPLAPGESTPSERLYQQKSNITETELRDVANKGRAAEVPPQKPTEEIPRDPAQPDTHMEFVKSVIEKQRLPEGYISLRSKKYILRPEAIESVWYMYRITGDSSWQDKGWDMFKSIIKSTTSKHGHSAIRDVTERHSYQSDEMESFWPAETLKYFYLLYSTPDTISLDEWVLNTEAHPFKRP